MSDIPEGFFDREEDDLEDYTPEEEELVDEQSDVIPDFIFAGEKKYEDTTKYFKTPIVRTDLSVCNTEYVLVDGNPVVVMFCRDSSGEDYVIPDSNFRPYFYIQHPALEHYQELDPANPTTPLGLKFEKIELRGFDSVYKLLKIYTRKPNEVSKYRSIIKGVVPFEADILYPNRYLIDKGIKSGITFDPKDGIIPNNNLPSVFKKLYVDIETLSFRSPNLKKVPDEVTVIGTYDDTSQQYVIFGTKPIKPEDLEPFLRIKKPITVMIFNREQDMFVKFIDYIESIRPDLFLSFTEFDWLYLVNRMNKLGIPYKRLSRVGVVQVMGEGSKVKIHGLQNLDLQNMYFRVFLSGSKWETLHGIAWKELGEEKLYREESVYENWIHRPERVYIRNLRDVEIIVRLDKELSLTDYFDAIRKIIGGNFADTVHNSRIADMMYLRLCHGKMALPTKTFKTKIAYQGAIVFPVKPGIYKKVVVFDWSSMYPSIIKSFNMSFETWASYDKIELLDLVYNIDNKYFFYKQPIGYTVQLLNELEPIRTPYKKKANDPSLTKTERNYNKAISDGVKSIINCFSEDTNVVTPYGFINIKDIKVGDFVFTLNPSTNTPEITKVTDTQSYDYTGPMIQILNKHVDFLVSPEHRFWIHKQSGWRWCTAEDLSSRFHLPPKVSLNFGNKLDIIDLASLTNLPIKLRKDQIKYDNKQSKWFPRFFDPIDFLRLAGWYISEGSIYRSSRKTYNNGNIRGITDKIQITQLYDPYKSEIRTLLTKMNIPFYEDSRGFSFCNKVLAMYLETMFGKGSYNKHIDKSLFSLTPDHLKYLIETMMKGDGRKRDPQYRTVSKQLAEDLCFIGTKCGLHCNYSADAQDTFTVYLNLLRGISPYIKQDKHISTIERSDKIYCFTTEYNHIILAGRNNKYQWTGQSIYGVFGQAGDQIKIKSYRMYLPDIAGATTYVGRTLELEGLKPLCDAIDYNIIYADTDSVFIQLKTDDTATEIKYLESYLTQQMSEFVHKRWGVDSKGLSLSFDKLYENLIMFVKKRYVGITSDGEQVVKGLEIIRRNTADISGESQEKISKAIFEDKTRDEIISLCKEIVSDFYKRPLEEIAIAQNITKDEYSYKTFASHLKAFLWSCEILNLNLIQGKRFWTIYIKPDEIPPQYRRTIGTIYLPDPTKKENFKLMEAKVNMMAWDELNPIPQDMLSVIDKDKMLNKVIKEKINPFLELLSIRWYEDVLGILNPKAQKKIDSFNNKLNKLTIKDYKVDKVLWEQVIKNDFKCPVDGITKCPCKDAKKNCKLRLLYPTIKQTTLF